MKPFSWELWERDQWAGHQWVEPKRRRLVSDGYKLWYLRIARETFCFQGLSFRIPIPKPERKKSSPVVTRSHFCDASNSNTALSQMKACSLLQEEEEQSHQVCGAGQVGRTSHLLPTCLGQPGWPRRRSRSCVSPCAGTWCSVPPAVWSRYPPSSASLWRRWTYLMGYAAGSKENIVTNRLWPIRMEN